MTKPPKWYTIIAVVAILWNLLGCIGVLSDLMIKPEDVARFTPDQQALYSSRTVWSMVSSVFAVLGGAIGSLGLLLRKKWAMLFLVASLMGLIVQDIGLFIIVNGLKLIGIAAIVLQGFIFLIALGLLMLVREATKRGWIYDQPNSDQ